MRCELADTDCYMYNQHICCGTKRWAIGRVDMNAWLLLVVVRGAQLLRWCAPVQYVLCSWPHLCRALLD